MNERLRPKCLWTQLKWQTTNQGIETCDVALWREAGRCLLRFQAGKKNNAIINVNKVQLKSPVKYIKCMTRSLFWVLWARTDLQIGCTWIDLQPITAAKCVMWLRKIQRSMKLLRSLVGRQQILQMAAGSTDCSRIGVVFKHPLGSLQKSHLADVTYAR